MLRDLGAPLLISANALALRRVDEITGPLGSLALRRADTHFAAFGPVPTTLHGADVACDSSGYVAMSAYGDYLCTALLYITWAAQVPLRFVSSLDIATEPELAGSDDGVLRRIAKNRRTLPG